MHFCIILFVIICNFIPVICRIYINVFLYVNLPDKIKIRFSYALIYRSILLDTRCIINNVLFVSFVICTCMFVYCMFIVLSYLLFPFL